MIVTLRSNAFSFFHIMHYVTFIYPSPELSSSAKRLYMYEWRIYVDDILTLESC